MRYKIHTYGCQMNVHDSEKIAGILMSLGYNESTDDDALADIIVFNTCCIRDTAEKKIIGNIGKIKSLKIANKKLKVVVCGCMTQQDNVAAELHAKFPFIDIIIGTHNIDRLSEFITLSNNNKHVIEIDKNNIKVAEKNEPFRTSYPNAWINITCGCNNFCTYCIVPYVRGREISRDMDSIIDDIKSLLANGYKEITLLGQNVNSYGNDIEDKEVNFANLLKRISALDGKFRLRFMTNHPKDFNKDVIDIIASSKNICNNVHLPLQSGSDAILKAMNRRYDREKYMSIIDSLKKAMPDIGITTDIMVGFPGETEEDFNDTMDIVRRARFSSAFTFIYSPRRGTPAAKMEQLPYSVKQARIKELIKLQNSITKELSQTYIGNTYEVLIEDVNPKYKGTLCGRTESGRLVNFAGDSSLIGSFANIKITSARSASLFGEIVCE